MNDKPVIDYRTFQRTARRESPISAVIIVFFPIAAIILFVILVLVLVCLISPGAMG